MWAFLEGVNASLALVCGICGFLAFFTRNIYSGFKSTNDFLKRKQEETESIKSTRDEVDILKNDMKDIKISLQDIKKSSDREMLERVKHNIITLSSDIKNKEDIPDIMFRFIIEECDWYEEKGYNGYMRPHIKSIRDAYNKRSGGSQ